MARPSAEPRSLKGVHVMLVSDDTERLALFKHMTDYAGALTTACASEHGAGRVLERLSVNVLVVDVAASGDSGRRLIAVLRAQGSTVPALALVARGRPAASQPGAGFHGHLMLPAHAAELCDAIANLARQPRS